MEQRLQNIESKVNNKEDDEEIDLSKFDEDTIKLANSIARKQAKEIIQEYGIQPQGNKDNGEMDKELEGFLDNFPESYKHLDEIEEYRKQYPKMSYAKIYRTFIMDDDYTASTPTKKNPLGSSSGTTPAGSTASDNDDGATKQGTSKDVDEEKAIEESFNKFK